MTITKTALNYRLTFLALTATISDLRQLGCEVTEKVWRATLDASNWTPSTDRLSLDVAETFDTLACFYNDVVEVLDHLDGYDPATDDLSDDESALVRRGRAIDALAVGLDGLLAGGDDAEVDLLFAMLMASVGVERSVGAAMPNEEVRERFDEIFAECDLGFFEAVSVASFGIVDDE